MCRKLLFLITFVSVLGLASNALAVDWNDADGDWSVATNWTGLAVPGSTDAVNINVGDADVAVSSDVGTVAGVTMASAAGGTNMSLTVGVGGSLVSLGNLYVGNGASCAGQSTLNITGGSVTANKIRLANGTPQGAAYTQYLNMTAGTLNVPGTHLGIGQHGTAIATIEGGTLNIGASGTAPSMMVSVVGDGQLDMSGGQLNVANSFLTGKNNWTNNRAHVQLDGGVIEILNGGSKPSGGFFAGENGVSTWAKFNITGGTLVLQGDQTSTIHAYVLGTNYWNWSTGATVSGTGNEVYDEWVCGYDTYAISDGVSTGVLVNYDSRAGKTYVTAIPEPTTIALLGLSGLFLLRRKRS